MRILISGGNGFLGNHLNSILDNKKNKIINFRSKNYDLTSIKETDKLFKKYHPDIFIHLAGDVGGINKTKNNPAKSFYNNIAMGINTVESSRKYNVKKYIMIGTICSYPKFSPVPFKEDDYWNGYPEETNAPYGIAKKSISEQLDAYWKEYNLNYVNIILTNIYGPGDNFDEKTSHVIPAIIKKLHYAKLRKDPYVEIWGDGSPTRDFLYVVDAAKAIKKLISNKFIGIVNVGSEKETSIKNLVNLINSYVKYDGKIKWNKNMPNGQPRRLVSNKRIKKICNFKPSVDLKKGIENTVKWYSKINV